MRYLLIAFIGFWVAACQAHDEHYYWLHPNALQTALTTCSQTKASQLPCERLSTLATYMSELAYELKISPQAFGQKILVLQETIAQQEDRLLSSAKQPSVEASLNENKQALQARLAIVRWLESPSSAA